MELTRELLDRRVAVARDLIGRIQAKTIKLRPGRYLLSSCDIDVQLWDLDDYSCQSMIDQVEAECFVCIRGGLLLSKIRLFNQVSGRQLSNAECGLSNATLLEDTFDIKELALMEAAFERHRLYGVRYGASDQDVETMQHLGQILGPEGAALHIAKEIVEQDGAFDVGRIAEFLKQENP